MNRKILLKKEGELISKLVPCGIFVVDKKRFITEWNDMANIISISDANVHRFQTSGLFVSLASGDEGTMYVNRDANHASDTHVGDIKILGILIEYTGDM